MVSFHRDVAKDILKPLETNLLNLVNDSSFNGWAKVNNKLIASYSYLNQNETLSHAHISFTTPDYPCRLVIEGTGFCTDGDVWYGSFCFLSDIVITEGNLYPNSSCVSDISDFIEVRESLNDILALTLSPDGAYVDSDWCGNFSYFNELCASYYRYWASAQEDWEDLCDEEFDGRFKNVPICPHTKKAYVVLLSDIWYYDQPFWEEMLLLLPHQSGSLLNIPIESNTTYVLNLLDNGLYIGGSLELTRIEIISEVST